MAFRHLLAAGLLVPALLPGTGWAAQLGRLTLQSGVGEPLRAEIEILSVRPNEAGSLAARIPPPEVFWRANLEPPAALDRLRVAVERRPNNRFVVSVRSSEPFDDPFIQLLVELVSSAGNAIREYPFLLEEPHTRGRAIAAPASPQIAPSVAAPVASALEPAERRGAPLRPGGYQVKSGDTLASIAQALKPVGATLEQAMAALFHANEQAFLNADPNRLRAGAVLAVPAAEAASAIDVDAARSLLRARRDAFDAHSKQIADAAVSAPRSRGPGAPPRTEAKSVPPPNAARDQFRVTSLETPAPGSRAAAAAREDDVTSLQRALAEAKARIGLLEKGIDDGRKLLVLKDQQLARVERRAAPGGAFEAAAAWPGDAAAANARYEPRGGEVSRFLGHYGGWLILGLVVGLASWILMPLKTVRLWRKKRRRRERDLRKHYRKVRRVAKDAGLLSTAS